VNLKEWAVREGVHHVTACRWFREGKLPVPARRVGRLILVDPAATATPVVEAVAVYARVSCAEQRADLDGQVAGVAGWVTGQGLAVDRVVTEVGSAAQGRRVLVVDPAGVDHDLVRDVTEILTSLCARRYGRRGAADRARRAVEAAIGDDPA
jgi:predicted site-specific integrase-resolvase